ncbi:hypothetical protein GRS48_04505 [Halorubrum sp. JWXQ-INN 858]|uniref:hypothetical protein n=1 Tax=Halorubrum sp. JWXQ-INN 858 TaxID=2690782 RepID=UPI001357B230|nr:hypothetical protein [Halorubrum sp. JWXQ-INN 858]MWV64088.1 hypothetical protein [Halorubrum sp. JWXQ-INN 858]
MILENDSSGPILRSLESIAARTDKWWYLPMLSGVSALFLSAVVFFTNTSAWALETFVVLFFLPTTVLAGPAVVFDILNKHTGSLPPGLFFYPPAFLIALFVGTFPLVTVVAVYLLLWVWPTGTVLRTLRN